MLAATASLLTPCAAMAAVLLYGRAPEAAPLPHDARELAECRAFVEEAPARRFHLFELEGLSPEWARLVACWDSVTELMDVEVPQWRSSVDVNAPRTERVLAYLIGERRTPFAEA